MAGEAFKGLMSRPHRWAWRQLRGGRTAVGMALSSTRSGVPLLRLPDRHTENRTPPEHRPKDGGSFRRGGVPISFIPRRDRVLSVPVRRGRWVERAVVRKRLKVRARELEMIAWARRVRRARWMSGPVESPVRPARGCRGARSGEAAATRQRPVWDGVEGISPRGPDGTSIV